MKGNEAVEVGSGSSGSSTKAGLYTADGTGVSLNKTIIRAKLIGRDTITVCYSYMYLDESYNLKI